MSMPDPAMWRQMLSHLRRHHAEICRQWFEELEPLELDGGVLQIRVNTPVQQAYLSRRCNDAFTEAAQAATGALVTVSFVDQEAMAEAAAALSHAAHGVVEADPPVRRPQIHISGRLTPPPSRPTLVHFDHGDDQIVLSPDYVFDNFVTGPGNHLAYAAAVAVAENPGRAYNPLFVHGGVGLGKTHLLQAICQKLLQNKPDARICYLSCDTFVNQFLEAVQNGQMSQFRTRYRHVDLLLIDDIHFLTNRERTQEEFFHTFNTLYQSNKQIVLSSDSPPNEIPQLEERLVSRFNWGLVARIDPPCYETRVAILKTKAKIRGIQLPDDAACYIAERIDSNIRELEGAVTKVQSLAMLRGIEPDLSLTREALGDDPAGAAGGPKLTIQNIIDTVTNYYGVKLLDLQSKRRHRSITVPRQVCMYLARKRTRYSLEEIGGYFGGRDHTTVMHAIRTTEDRMTIEPDFNRQIDQLDRKLTENLNG
ncbi:MAG: chromosomal replication initiator protein DnaA [Planctomycetes bacterium]|nr:chromosomal replication initiator protein DnaA [Planctomycetota bacterium]